MTDDTENDNNEDSDSEKRAEVIPLRKLVQPLHTISDLERLGVVDVIQGAAWKGSREANRLPEGARVGAKPTAVYDWIVGETRTALMKRGFRYTNNSNLAIAVHETQSAVLLFSSGRVNSGGKVGVRRSHGRAFAQYFDPSQTDFLAQLYGVKPAVFLVLWAWSPRGLEVVELKRAAPLQDNPARPTRFEDSCVVYRRKAAQVASGGLRQVEKPLPTTETAQVTPEAFIKRARDQKAAKKKDLKAAKKKDRPKDDGKDESED